MENVNIIYEHIYVFSLFKSSSGLYNPAEVSKPAKAAIENTIEYELFIAWQISHTTTRSGYCPRLAPHGLDLIGEAATSKGSCSYTIPQFF